MKPIVMIIVGVLALCFAPRPACADNKVPGANDGTPSPVQAAAFNHALNHLATTHGSEAAAIASSITNGNLTIRRLDGAPGELGASDGDTMLLNFPRTVSVEDLSTIILHEWQHIVHGDDGVLGPCQEALNYNESAHRLVAYTCDLNVKDGVCMRVRQTNQKAEFCRWLCELLTGFSQPSSTAATTCCPP